MSVKNYQGEVGEPTIPPARGGLQLEFDGKKLLMLGGVGNNHYPAVSGTGKGDTIPVGSYWIAPKELWQYSLKTVSAGVVADLGRQDPFRASQTAGRLADSWGMYRITIHAFPGTKRGTRGGFFIHGGANPGSLGCIDLMHNMDGFVADLQKALGLEFRWKTWTLSPYIWEDESAANCYIPLRVRYSS